MLARLRNYFLTGIVITAPLVITGWLVWWFVSLFDGWLKPIIPAPYNPDHYLPFSVPGVGVLIALVGLTLIGALAANLVGRSLIRMGETTLNRMPVVRTIYKAIKQIFETVLSSSAGNFRSVGMIEFPRKGVYAIVFVAREVDSSEIGLPAGEAMYSVFMPTTPNPTTGFLMFFRKSDVHILKMTVEEGAKLIISAGLLTPHQVEEATLAEEAGVPFNPVVIDPRTVPVEDDDEERR